jgi:hypothetical protein
MNDSQNHKSNLRRNLGRALAGAGILATVVALFYLEEDWRGKHAWAKCRAELEAQGTVLDWNKYLPPQVADGQNFFTASTNMMLRFHKAQSPAEGEAAGQLQWLRLPPLGSNSYPVFKSGKSTPLVVAELTFVPSAPKAGAAAAAGLIINFNDSAARGQVREVLEKTIGRSISGATGIEFSELPLDQLVPARLILQADAVPSAAELEQFIPPDLGTNLGRWRVAAGGDGGTFQISLADVQVTAAADYLKWSGQFVPAFDDIREALKRPCAIIPGDYSQPFEIPIPNFVMLRSLVQTLAQRAQCDLLLAKPDQALREVTLMHDVCRILEKPPVGKPLTLVESMINVAITGLYVSVIADGLRLHVWQEPQLTALRAQLKEINLPSWVAESLRDELAADVTVFESTPANKISDAIYGPRVKARSVWTQLKDPLYLFLKFAPRGWVCQNLVNMAALEPKPVNSFDLEHDTVSPRIFDESVREAEKFLAHPSPFKILIGVAMPNFTKATQTTAHNQTLANEGQIACALESYHLANGEYPETLAALVPKRIAELPHDLIGGQPLHYRRTDDGKFLLYSVGWNEKDDGGKGSSDLTKGDWVWRQ